MQYIEIHFWLSHRISQTPTSDVNSGAANVVEINDNPSFFTLMIISAYRETNFHLYNFDDNIVYFKYIEDMILEFIVESNTWTENLYVL